MKGTSITLYSRSFCAWKVPLLSRFSLFFSCLLKILLARVKLLHYFDCISYDMPETNLSSVSIVNVHIGANGSIVMNSNGM